MSGRDSERELRIHIEGVFRHQLKPDDDICERALEMLRTTAANCKLHYTYDDVITAISRFDRAVVDVNIAIEKLRELVREAKA